MDISLRQQEECQQIHYPEPKRGIAPGCRPPVLRPGGGGIKARGIRVSEGSATSTSAGFRSSFCGAASPAVVSIDLYLFAVTENLRGVCENDGGQAHLTRDNGAMRKGSAALEHKSGCVDEQRGPCRIRARAHQNVAGSKVSRFGCLMQQSGRSGGAASGDGQRLEAPAVISTSSGSPSRSSGLASITRGSGRLISARYENCRCSIKWCGAKPTRNASKISSRVRWNTPSPTSSRRPNSRATSRRRS